MSVRERLKELEERGENSKELKQKILKYLWKRHGNYQCFNCCTEAPEYVCMDFRIFVCEKCGDLHKEFGHQVKPAFKYEFNSDELDALRAGGNFRALGLYLENWGNNNHWQRNEYNLDRLREFIKHVFVKKIFMGTGSRRPEKVLPFVEDPLDKYVPRLPISEPPQKNRTKAGDRSALRQKTEYSRSMPSSSRNTAEVKLETTKDLIDFGSGVNYNWTSFENVKANHAPPVQHASCVIAPTSSFATFPSSGASAWQDPQPSFPPNVRQPLTNQPAPVGVLNTQPQVIHPSSTIQGHPSMPPPHWSHISNPATGTSSIAASGPSVDVNPSGIKELPEYLFSSQYPSYPAAVPRWGTIPSYGMGMPTPYYNVLQAMQSFQQPPRSTNPFDFGSEQPPVQTPTLAWQPSLPSSISNPSYARNPPVYGQMWPPQPHPHPSAMATGPYMGQVQPTVAMPSHENIRSFGGEGTAYGFSNIYQHPSTSSTSSASSSSNVPPYRGRYPFG